MPPDAVDVPDTPPQNPARPNAMKKPALRLVLWLLALLLLLAAGRWLARQMAIDACLDSGGRWQPGPGGQVVCDKA